jgi:hypothetical protein
MTFAAVAIWKRTKDGGYVSLPGRALSRADEIENETLIPE